MVRFVFRKARQHLLKHLNHFYFIFANAPTDGKTIKGKLRDFPCSLHTKVFIEASLDNSESGLMRLCDPSATLDYSRARGLGSAAFVAGSLGLGFAIDAFGPPSALATVVILCAILAAGAWLLAPEQVDRSAEPPIGARLREGLGLVKHPAFFLVRWAILSTQPDLMWLIPLQALHGLSFAATYLGTMRLIQRWYGNDRAPTAQMMYQSFAAAPEAALASLLAGPLYDSFGALGYLGMVGLAVVGVLLALRLRKTPPPSIA